MNDYFSVVLMPLLVERVRAKAEHCVLEVIHMPRTGVANNRNYLDRWCKSDLDEGSIDVAVMTADNFPSRFAVRRCSQKEGSASCQPIIRRRKSLTLNSAVSRMGHVKVTSVAQPARLDR